MCSGSILYIFFARISKADKDFVVIQPTASAAYVVISSGGPYDFTDSSDFLRVDVEKKMLDNPFLCVRVRVQVLTFIKGRFDTQGVKHVCECM